MLSLSFLSPFHSSYIYSKKNSVTSSFVDQFGHTHHSISAVLDRETEYVPCHEPGGLVHVLEEHWVLVGIPDVHQSPHLCHVASYSLTNLNADRFLLCVCVYMCVCVRVHACVHVCACVCVCNFSWPH